jgi:hypothetical protein
MPAVDGRGLDKHQRVPPPRPHASQDQPEQTVSLAKSSIRTGEDAQLVTQGEDFEQQASPCWPPEPDRREGPHDATHRA